MCTSARRGLSKSVLKIPMQPVARSQKTMILRQYGKHAGTTCLEAAAPYCSMDDGCDVIHNSADETEGVDLILVKSEIM